jgi:hypothetical protein
MRAAVGVRTALPSSLGAGATHPHLTHLEWFSLRVVRTSCSTLCEIRPSVTSSLSTVPVSRDLERRPPPYTLGGQVGCPRPLGATMEQPPVDYFFAGAASLAEQLDSA